MKKRAGSLLVAFGLALAPSVDADTPPLRAELECQRARSPGRVVCELRISASSGTLVWSDALVVRAPPFARPLRSRVSAELGTSAEPGVAKAKLALVASEPGQAPLGILARAVGCREHAAGEGCFPEVLSVSAPVQVDAPPPSGP